MIGDFPRDAELPARRKKRQTTFQGIVLECREMSPGKTMQDHLNAYEAARRKCLDEGGSEVSSNPNKSPTICAIAAVVQSVMDGYSDGRLSG